MVVNFNLTTHPNGVDDVSFIFSDTIGTITYKLYGVDGALLGTTTSTSATPNMPVYQNVAKVEIIGGGTTAAQLKSVNFYDGMVAGTVTYVPGTTNAGIQINGTGINNKEIATIVFNQSTHPYGVQDVVLTVDADSNLASASFDAYTLTYSVYSIDGTLLGQFSSINEGAITIPSIYSNIGKITIEAGGNSAGTTNGYVTDISYKTISANTSAVEVPEVQVEYTLEDSNGDSSSATLSLNVITNTILGDSGVNTLTGTTGNDLLQGLAGNDTLNAGAGHDVLIGDEGNDTLNGEAGNDILNGRALDGALGNDTLTGGAGLDRLFGGEGNDTLTGGADADRFVYSEIFDNGTDHITDFQLGIDSIVVADLVATEQQFSWDDATHTLTLGNGSAVVLDGLASGQTLTTLFNSGSLIITDESYNGVL